ncbi:unnamed protein product [Ceratitis capitata]|uniref:(Mediterranean fruit fly) hypothetical protein n=1 Tax=Ceratitis capitata TaxID=7213 RepID=A0A811U0U6_CERCA|nr:unnamed protein product [Ceratitis capitata]
MRQKKFKNNLLERVEVYFSQFSLQSSVRTTLISTPRMKLAAGSRHNNNSSAVFRFSLLSPRRLLIQKHAIFMRFLYAPFQNRFRTNTKTIKKQTRNVEKIKKNSRDRSLQ